MGDAEDDRIQDALADYKARIARSGGVGRAKKLSAKRRKEIATKASKAAAKKRSAEAKKKRRNRRS